VAEEPVPAAPEKPAQEAGTPGSLGTADLRRFWPQILDNVKNRRRFTWILLSQNAQIVEVRDSVLTLGLSNVGAKDSFGRGGSPDVLREAILEVLGIALHIEPIVDATAGPAPGASAPAATAAEPPASPASPPRSQAAQAARANLRPTRSQASAPEAEPEAEPTREDTVVEESANADELMMKHLGAELIAEDDNG
jgi:DNA polymerase-3 subunit gamma/tau